MLTPLLNDRKLILAQVSCVTEFCCTIKLSWRTYTLVLNVITIRSLIFITLRLGFSLGRKMIFYSGSIFMSSQDIFVSSLNVTSYCVAIGQADLQREKNINVYVPLIFITTA